MTLGWGFNVEMGIDYNCGKCGTFLSRWVKAIDVDWIDYLFK